MGEEAILKERAEALLKQIRMGEVYETIESIRGQDAGEKGLREMQRKNKDG